MSIEHACLMWEEVLKAHIVLMGSSNLSDELDLSLQTQDPVGPSNNLA